MNSDTTYTNPQVWNEDIWVNVASIPSIVGQGNGLIGEFLLSVLYKRICLTPYEKNSNPGNNPSYQTGTTQAARKSIKYIW